LSTTYKENEPVWLVKSGGTILGPFSLIDIIQGLKERKVAILDEVKTPNSRWMFIREQAQLADIVKVIRQEDGAMPQETGVTQVGSSELTRSITLDINDDNTPVPAFPERSPSTEAQTKQRVPLPQPRVSIGKTGYAKAKKSFRRPALIFSVLMIAVIGYLAVGKRGPQAISADELLRLARQYKTVGFYDKALVLYLRAASISQPNLETKKQMVPLMLTEDKPDVKAARYLADLFMDNESKRQIPMELNNWTGLIYLKEGRFDEAAGEFNKVLTTDADHKIASLNFLSSLFLAEKYIDAENLILKMREKDTSHEIILSVAAQIVLSGKSQKLKNQISGLIEDFYKYMQTHRAYKVENLLLLAALQNHSSQASQSALTIRQLLGQNPDESALFLNELDVSYETLSWKFMFPLCNRLADQQKKNVSGRQLVAFCRVKSGEMNLAQTEIEQVNQEFPQDNNLTGLQAYILKRQGRLPEAKVLANASPNYLGQIIKAQICLEEKDIVCTDLTLNAILEADPVDPMALTLLARLHLAKNQKELARQDIDKGIFAHKNFRPLLEIREEAGVY
jgi:tetratricopeptide (TPR) repeat protein